MAKHFRLEAENNYGEIKPQGAKMKPQILCAVLLTGEEVRLKHPRYST